MAPSCPHLLQKKNKTNIEKQYILITCHVRKESESSGGEKEERE